MRKLFTLILILLTSPAYAAVCTITSTTPPSPVQLRSAYSYELRISQICSIACLPTCPPCGPPYTYSITGGTLPPGIAIGYHSGYNGSQTGYLQGAPTQFGLYHFTLAAHDNSSPPVVCTPVNLTIQVIGHKVVYSQ